MVSNSAKAATCLDVFPSAINGSLLGSGNELINIPPFTGADWYMGSVQTIPLGDSQHYSWYSQQTVIVNPAPVSETSARLYISGGVNWVNAKINVGGNPEDLIIVTSGSIGISGGQTEINAIIYSLASISVSGNVTINGAIAAEGSISTTPSADINYDQNAIENSDFNGMCDGAIAPPAQQCLDFFPAFDVSSSASSPISMAGTISSDTVDMKEEIVCTVNGNTINNCDRNDVVSMASVRSPNFPTDAEIDALISVSGTFNQSSIDNNAYMKYKSWNNNRTTVTYIPTDGSTNGSAVLYFDGNGDNVEIPNEAEINLDGKPENLLIVVKGQDFIIGEEAKINAFIYVDVTQDVKILKEAEINGALAVASGKLIIEDEVIFTYQTDDLSNLDSHGFCSTAPPPVIPIANYQFDECSYTGASFEVIDQIGSYPATAINNVDTNKLGQIERFIDISNEYQHIETSIPVPASFSISTWFKKPTSTSDNRYFILGAMQSGGDLLYLDRDNSWRWGVFDGSNSTDGQFSFSSLDDNWHHLTLVYTSGNTQLYIDGVFEETISRAPSGTLKYIGTSFDDINSSNPQGFRAPLDEFLVYDLALNASDVLTVYNNQLAKSNYDGTDRDPAQCSSLIAYYQMDELSWNGTSGEVLSEVGTLHGTAFGGLSTDRFNPAKSGNPGTCGYGEFDGIDDYVQIADDPMLDLADQFTITTWIYPTKIPSSGLMTILSKDENYEFHVTPSGEINWWWNDANSTIRDFDSSGANITANNWYHIAITYKDGEQVIYINSVNKGQSSYSGNLIVNNDPLQIGQDQFQSSRYFKGFIDEVKIFDGALSSADIDVIYQETHPCESYIDHFKIDTQNAQGLTCEPDLISIKACSDASCSILNPDAVDVILSVSDAGGVVLNKNVTVVGGEVDVNYIHTKAEVVSLSLDQTFECLTGASTSCDVTFADAGFRFYENTETNPIPTQVSAKPSNTLKIQAIEKNPDTGACQAAFIDTTAIEMAATCVDPIACAGSQVAINNLSTSADIVTLDNSAVLSYSSVGLDFSDDTVNSAEFIFTYPDAGKIQLHARYNIPDDNGDPSGNYMLGSSNKFVVRPFGFFINIIDNPDPAATDEDGDVFKKAGVEFTTVIKAVQWQVDGDSNLSDNPITKNFGSEQVAETAEITPSMVLPNLSTLPVPGVLGSLTNTTFDSFSASSSGGQGTATNNDMTYSEVGIISFNANLTDNSYLGADDVVGSEPYVGRFIPDHFVLAKFDGDLVAMCDSGTSPEPTAFAYSGQMSSASPSTGGAIRYEASLNPSFTITAMSLNGANPTLNYTGVFMKLVGSSITRLAPSFDYAKDGSLGTKLALTADLKSVETADLAGNEGFGVVTYSYKNDDNFVYQHELNAEINKFTTDINLTIVSVVDPDGVTAKDADGDFDGGDPTNALDSVLTLEPTGVEIRFGRAQLENSYGPETSNLPQPLSVNYFKDGQYVLSVDDNCTRYNADNMKVANTGVSEPLPLPLPLPLPGIDPVDGEFINETPPGQTRAIELTAPGAGKIGQVEVIYDISDWLKYDWAYDDEGVDGLYNDNPRAVATFGIYRGNDRIIYQREIEKIN